MPRLRATATRPAWALAAILGQLGCAPESRRPPEVEVTIAEPPRPGTPQKIQAAAVPRRNPAPLEPIEPCIASLRGEPVPGTVADAGADLYRRAMASEQAGDLNVARKLYFQLIDNQTRSAFVPASYFAFAELFRAESREDPAKWALAEQAYQQVLKYPPADNSLFQVARLRLAEVQGALGEDQESLSSYAGAIKDASPGTCANAAAGAALEAIVPVFAKLGDPKKAPVFFASLRGAGAAADRERTADVTLRLVQLYLDAKRPSDAAAALRALAAQGDASTDALCTRGHALAVQTGDASADAAVASRCSPP